MTREEVYAQLNDVFRDVFGRDDIAVDDSTVAADIAGWDSLMHITLINTVEDEFDIQFNMKQVIGMNNVGEMVDIIVSKM